MAGAIYPDLKGQSVLVTGGGSGIGESIVRAFARQGAKVGFVDINAEASARWLARSAMRAGPSISNRPTSATFRRSRRHRAIREVNGPVTILVNNAAHDERHAIEAVTPEYLDDRFAVNLRHQFFASQAVVPDMKRGGRRLHHLLRLDLVAGGQGGMPVYTGARPRSPGSPGPLARDSGPAISGSTRSCRAGS